MVFTGLFGTIHYRFNKAKQKDTTIFSDKVIGDGKSRYTYISMMATRSVRNCKEKIFGNVK